MEIQWVERKQYVITKNRVLVGAANQVKEYFQQRRRNFSVRINPAGTEFRKKVWNACTRIPYGKTMAYKDLASLAGVPKAIRAVGGAMATNPLPIVVPCHRVVAANGGLGGYSGGKKLVTKKFLLKLEGAI